MVAAARSMKSNRRLIILPIMAVVVFIVGALSIITTRSSVEDPFPTGTIRVAIDPGVPPFGFIDANGDITGIDADIARAIAEALDVDVVLTPIGFDALYDSFATLEIDAIISTLIADPNRMADVLYTRPYFNAGLVLVSSVSTATALDELSGHSIAYEFGSSADSELRRWMRRIKPFDTQSYERPEFALDAVRLGVADAALVDNSTAQTYIAGHPDWRPLVNEATDVGYVVGVPISAPKSFESIDSALHDLLANGEIEAIVENWFHHSTE